MTVDLDRKALEILVRGCKPSEKALSNPLVESACSYVFGVPQLIKTDHLFDEELLEVYQVCQKSETNISALTNSEIGSKHWLNTMLGQILHIGEYMEDSPIEEEVRKNWGRTIQEYAGEIMNNYEAIVAHGKRRK